MSYTVYDFSESLVRCEQQAWQGKDGRLKSDVKRVAAAWGISGYMAEWEGGFLCELRDGKWMYIAGWCDTTGWGCQDGIEVKLFDTKPELGWLTRDTGDSMQFGASCAVKPSDWDLEPTDLNRFLRGEIEADYESE